MTTWCEDCGRPECVPQPETTAPCDANPLPTSTTGTRRVGEREVVERGGVAYSRFAGDEHFHAARREEPGVLCGKCQGYAFKLQFGEYEVLARCVRCGFQACVYSG